MGTHARQISNKNINRCEENKENKTAAFLRERSRFSRGHLRVWRKTVCKKSGVRVIDASLGGDRSTMLLSTILSSRDVGRGGATGAIGFSTRWENWIEIEIVWRKFAFSRHYARWKLRLCARM